MHLSRLTLTNVRQFEQRTFEFQPGFNLLVGENGAGKTTILRSLLAAMGGTQQLGRRPRLEDDDIRLHTRHAEVRTKIQLSNGDVEETYFQKTLWERAKRSHRRNVPLTLLYSSNEATCPGMKVKRAKQFRGFKDDELRRDEEFLYESEMRFARRPVNQAERLFGHSQSVSDFVGRMLSTFSSDFGNFYWRFEPYDCELVPADNLEMEELANVEIRDHARAFAMRYFQEAWPRRRKMPFEWPDQARIVLTPESKERTRRDRYLPDLSEIWEGMRISPEIRKILL
jgi:energy-coupling factor transporter ATP-binding protein EcfA2